MILIDFSSNVHRHLHNAVKEMKPSKKDGKFVTSEYINYWKHLIFEELFRLEREFQQYGKMVICLDDFGKRYWRKEFYHLYKANRSKDRGESDVDFGEFFGHVNEFVKELQENTPWKVFGVEEAEADDIILVLAKEYANKEPILIYSPDKDFIQCQRYSDTIKQLSPLTKKYLTFETKSGSMLQWIHEHICLGDACDNVPRIVDETEFSTDFIEYLQSQNMDISVSEWKQKSESERDFIELGFKVANKDCEVYKKHRFGASTLSKNIEQYGGLNQWLKTNPLLEENFKRNYILVMLEGIPENIYKNILEEYVSAATSYESKRFENFLSENNLKSIIPLLPSAFRTALDLDFFDDWSS